MGKNVTTKMESSEILADLEISLPYLEKGAYDGDRNLASVGGTWKAAYFLDALP